MISETSGEAGRPRRVGSEQGASAASLREVQDPRLLLQARPVERGYLSTRLHVDLNRNSF